MGAMSGKMKENGSSGGRKIDKSGRNMERKKMSPFDLVAAFLVPTIVGKAAILYFGANYAGHPGRGYGVGLVVAFLFTLCMIGRFLWKYRNYED
jgi:hypothetical protein